jgi:hypothetical protein
MREKGLVVRRLKVGLASIAVHTFHLLLFPNKLLQGLN